MRRYVAAIELDDHLKAILRAAGAKPTAQDEMILSRFLHVTGLAIAEIEISAGRMVCRYKATDILRSYTAKTTFTPKLNKIA